jgi:hypothetical protein
LTWGRGTPRKTCVSLPQGWRQVNDDHILSTTRDYLKEKH